jgi:hypothetical protein
MHGETNKKKWGVLSVGEVREGLGVEFTLVTFVMLVVLVNFLECLKKRMSQCKAFIFFTHLYKEINFTQVLAV